MYEVYHEGITFLSQNSNKPLFYLYNSLPGSSFRPLNSVNLLPDYGLMKINLITIYNTFYLHIATHVIRVYPIKTINRRNWIIICFISRMYGLLFLMCTKIVVNLRLRYAEKRAREREEMERQHVSKIEFAGDVDEKGRERDGGSLRIGYRHFGNFIELLFVLPSFFLQFMKNFCDFP